MPKNHSLSMSSRLALTGVAMGMLGACTALAGDSTFDSSAEVALPSQAVQYQNINPAIQMGTAWGDRSAGQHGTFGKFPADFITPFHTHSGAYHGVVVAGTMTNPFEGEQNPPRMSPGSYWHVPADAVHATACVSSTPCQFYFHADSSFDFTPVE